MTVPYNAAVVFANRRRLITLSFPLLSFGAMRAANHVIALILWVKNDRTMTRLPAIIFLDMCCLNTTYDGRLPAGVDSAGEAISGQKFLPVGDPARALKELHSRHAILIDRETNRACSS